MSRGDQCCDCRVECVFLILYAIRKFLPPHFDVDVLLNILADRGQIRRTRAESMGLVAHLCGDGLKQADQNLRISLALFGPKQFAVSRDHDVVTKLVQPSERFGKLRRKASEKIRDGVDDQSPVIRIFSFGR